MFWEILGVWVAALLTLCILSFLYRDNPLYKVAEHIFVGVSTGYLVVIAIRDALWRDVYEPLFTAPRTEYIVILPAILGLCLFLRYSDKLAPISRVPVAFFVGVTAGTWIPNYIEGYIIQHTGATIVPLFGAGTGWVESINNLIILIGVLSVLVYFFFSVPHRGAVRGVARTGTIYLMLFFGAAFGYTVMGRVSILIGRMRFLLIEWLGL